MGKDRGPGSVLHHYKVSQVVVVVLEIWHDLNPVDYGVPFTGIMPLLEKAEDHSSSVDIFE